MKKTSEEYKEYKGGEKLANGATAILGKPGFVLAMMYSEDFNRIEFVTWATNKAGDTFCGHYFGSLRSALDDFDARR